MLYPALARAALIRATGVAEWPGGLLAGAVRARALDQQVDFLTGEAGRHFDAAGQGDVGEARHHVAIGALEMRVFMVMVADLRTEAPHLVGAGDAVDQAIDGQPLEHAVQRDGIERLPAHFRHQLRMNVMVRQGLVLLEQEHQHARARARQPGASVSDE
jgi:hypothetical protein